VCEREREEETYTRSVHWISFLRFFILRRRSGARTSNTHLSVSWSAIDLRPKRSFFSSKVGFFVRIGEKNALPVKVKYDQLLVDGHGGGEENKRCALFFVFDR